ncbi:MAG: protein kinase [Deltaproteobacteria bacterium]|nr:protein kinase [Deltaproteobacteria bacterium]
MGSSPGAKVPTTLAPGDVFARDFRVVSRLASGGMGVVYVVEQTGTGRRRALKLMHPELAHHEKSRERFEREALIGSRIDSEHVVEVVAAGLDDATGVPWLAMELLEGTDLATHVTTRGPMPRAEVLEVFRQLGHALDAGHRVGIIHRDLKPENVFLARSRRSDARFTVKVLDFGIAKWMQEVRAATMASQAIGTPYWMAPEQTDARGQIAPTTDVWPLGLIAFYLLTGKIYWAAAHERDASMGAMIAEIMALPIEPPSVRAAKLGVAHLVPPGFDEWFAHCVVRDPAQRFARIPAVVGSLEPILVPPVVAGTVGLAHAPQPVGPASARDGRTVAGARDGRTVAGARDGQTVAAARDDRTPIPLTAMPPRKPSRTGRALALILVVVLVAVAGIGGAAVLLKRRASRRAPIAYVSDAGAIAELPTLPPPPTFPNTPTTPTLPPQTPTPPTLPPTSPPPTILTPTFPTTPPTPLTPPPPPPIVPPPISPTLAVVVPGNLVADGGFETGSLGRPWGTGIYEPRGSAFWGRANATATLERDSHAGQHALLIVNRTPTAPHVYRTLSQRVANTERGRRYCLTYWARTTDAQAGTLTITVNDSWGTRFGVARGTSPWTLYAGTFTAEKSRFDLRLISENVGNVSIDDIALTEGDCAVPDGPVTAGMDPRSPRWRVDVARDGE